LGPLLPLFSALRSFVFTRLRPLLPEYVGWGLGSSLQLPASSLQLQVSRRLPFSTFRRFRVQTFRHPSGIPVLLSPQVRSQSAKSRPLSPAAQLMPQDGTRRGARIPKQ